MKLTLNKKNLKKIKKDYFVFGFFTFLVFLFYGNTLFNGFVHDDIPQITENPFIKEIRYLPKAFTGCIWEYVLGSCKGTTQHYRPLQSLSYLLTWQISSQPWFFHFIHLFYFSIAVCLVFIFAKTLTKNPRLAFLASLVFLIYPIHFENANWLATVPEFLSAIFVLLAAIYYLKYRKTKNIKNLILVSIFYLLALLARETVIFLPLVLLSIDFLILKNKPKKVISIKTLKEFSFLAAASVFYIILRTIALGGIGGFYLNTSYLNGYSFPERIYAYSVLFGKYLGKVFYPFPLPILFLDVLEIKSHLLNLQFIGSLFLFLVYIGLIIFLIKKKKGVFAFCLIWFISFILVEVIFFNMIGEKGFAERYLFIPLIGFVLLFGYFLDYLWQKNKIPHFNLGFLLSRILSKKQEVRTKSRSPRRRSPAFNIVSWRTDKKIRTLISVFLFLLTLGSLILIFPKNKVWRDSETLYRTIINLNPAAWRVRQHLADELNRLGKKEEAKIELEEIVRNNADWKFIGDVYSKIGHYYLEKKELDRAEEYFQKSLENIERSGNYKNYNNLGAIALEQQKYLKALIYFCQALQLAPDAPEANSNFNMVASVVASVDQENFIFLYMEVKNGEDFKRSGEEKIIFKKKICNLENCVYVFAPQTGPDEAILPFLIMAEAFPQEIIKVEKPSYNPAANEITITLDPKYKERLVTFFFPTCEGIYYSVDTE